MKKLLFVSISVVMAVMILVSCSSNGKAMDSYDVVQTPNTYSKIMESESFGFDGNPIPSAVSAVTNTEYERKVIKTVNIVAETKEYDDGIKALDQLINSVGGYVESSESHKESIRYNNSHYTRNASYTIRVPADKLDEFMETFGDKFNITSNIGSNNDVSEKYYDIESRLTTLEAEKQALLKMYENADTVEYMLNVQERLYDVIEEIESYTTQLNYYKSKVAYSTVILEIYEVIDYTEISDEPRTYGERIKKAFKDSWKDFADGSKNFFVWLVYALPTILVIAVVVGAIVAIVNLTRKAVKKKRAGRSADSEDKQ